MPAASSKKCLVCDGRGYFVCPTCAGSGREPKFEGYGHFSHMGAFSTGRPCPKCGGSGGKVVCHTCSGQGTVG